MSSQVGFAFICLYRCPVEFHWPLLVFNYLNYHNHCWSLFRSITESRLRHNWKEQKKNYFWMCLHSILTRRRFLKDQSTSNVASNHYSTIRKIDTNRYHGRLRRTTLQHRSAEKCFEWMFFCARCFFFRRYYRASTKPQKYMLRACVYKQQQQ